MVTAKYTYSLWFLVGGRFYEQDYRESVVQETANSESSLDFSHESQDNSNKFGGEETGQETNMNWKERALQLERGLLILYVTDSIKSIASDLRRSINLAHPEWLYISFL
jgi:hypothetical protein